MKTFRLVAIGFIFASFLGVSAFAQTEPKIALVDTNTFYAQGGIKKVEDGYKRLEVEFTGVEKELNTLKSRIEALQKELQVLQTQAADPKSKVPINQNQFQSKVDELDQLQVDFKRKQEDAKKKFEKREAEILNPISRDIGKSIGDFAKQKGYTLVFDSSKLIRSGILLYLQNTTDITKEFITYYNSRPGGTASN